MQKIVYLIVLLFTFAVVTSCIDRPDIVLDEPQLIDVLVDVHRAEGLLEMQQSQNRHPDENERYQKEVIAAVLQKHGVSKAQYDSTLMWYAQNLKLLTRVYGHVDERLREEHDHWSLQASEMRTFAISEAGDSVELWSLREHLVLDPLKYSAFRFWEIPSDSNYVDGDTLRWHFRVQQLLPGQRLIASISLTEAAPKEDKNSRPSEKKKQTGDPLGSCQQVISANGNVTLVACTDSVQPFGSAILSLALMYDSAHQSPVFVDSLSLLRMHRNE